MKLTLKRETLYEEVWSTPKKKLTKKYGISYYRRLGYRGLPIMLTD